MNGIPRSHQLSPRGSSGIWEGFIPGVGKGTLYKFHIESRQHGYRVDKADPLGLLHEKPPRTASVVWDLDYQWNDHEWMQIARDPQLPARRRSRSTKCISDRGCASRKITTAR